MRSGAALMSVVTVHSDRNMDRLCTALIALPAMRPEGIASRAYAAIEDENETNLARRSATRERAGHSWCRGVRGAETPDQVQQFVYLERLVQDLRHPQCRETLAILE